MAIDPGSFHHHENTVVCTLLLVRKQGIHNRASSSGSSDRKYLCTFSYNLVPYDTT